MAKSVQDQQLAEWFHQMGCPVELTPQNLQTLNNNPTMRSVWRHLQRYVKPVSTVRIIKKNLLLSRLRSLLPGKFGNFKIETVQELLQLQTYSATQEEIQLLKGKIKAVDESLLSATNSLVTKVTKRESMRHNLEEIYNKSALLDLKLSCVRNDIETLEKELQTARVLKICPAQMSHLEMKEKKLLVTKFVQQFSVEISDDCINEMIVATSEFPSSVIFEGIISVSKHALNTLNSTKIANIWGLLNLSNQLNISNHLKNLNLTLFKNELELHNSTRTTAACEAELVKQRALLRKVMEESLSSSTDSEHSTVVELIDQIVQNTLLIKRQEKLNELFDELQDACSSDFEHAKERMSSYKDKECRLVKELNEKLSDINKLTGQISTLQVSCVKAEVLLSARDLVSKFFSQLENQKGEEKHFQALVSENLISKEIELFQNLPLVVMTRQWEHSFETIPWSVREDILKAPELLNYLCQSESKNLIKNIVEKIFWLHTNNNNQLTY